MKLKLFFAILFLSGSTQAQVAGDYDNSFGTNGKVVVSDPPSSKVKLSNIAVQSDGKIVVVNKKGNLDTQFHIQRFLSDGTKDLSFGTNGISSITLPSYTVSLKNITIQPDGKILAGGDVYPNAFNSDHYCGIVRLNPNGSLDTTFGNGGKVTFAYSSYANASDEINKIVVQPDGKILTAGMSYDGTKGSFAVARLNADGSFDTGFGTGGKQVKSFPATIASVVYNVKVLPNGNILLAGTIGNSFGLVKLMPNGDFDTSFNTTGAKSYASDLTGNYSVMTFLPDQSMIFAGVTSSGQNKYFKFNSNLQLDPAFGTGGTVTTGTSSGNYQESGVSRMVTDNEGRIFALGRINGPGSVLLFSVTCFTPNGAIDNSFATNGRLVINHGYLTNGPFDCILQADQKLLISGYITNDQYSTLSDGFLNRFHTQMSVLGTAEKNKISEFTVFPNPVKDIVTIGHLDKKIFNQSIEIVDGTGKLILQQRAQHETEKIDISHLSSGIYYIKIGSELSKKVIKK